MWLPEEHHHRPELSLGTPLGPRCGMCGTPFKVREKPIAVTGLTSTLEGFFRDRTFCSFACVRSFFLEILTALDRMVTPATEAEVSDLRTTYADLAAAFAMLLEDWNLRGDDPGRGT